MTENHNTKMMLNICNCKDRRRMREEFEIIDQFSNMCWIFTRVLETKGGGQANGIEPTYRVGKEVRIVIVRLQDPLNTPHE